MSFNLPILKSLRDRRRFGLSYRSPEEVGFYWVADEKNKKLLIAVNTSFPVDEKETASSCIKQCICETGTTARTETEDYDTMEFFPTYDIPGCISYATWLRDFYPKSQHSKKESPYYSYYLFCKARGYDEIWDAEWDRLVSPTIFTGVIPLFGDPSNVDTSAIVDQTRSYFVPDDVKDKLTSALEERFGAGNVYVSKQVFSLKDIGTPSVRADLLAQGIDRLANKVNYIKHCYDKQTFKANEPIVPAFCIVVSMRELTKRVSTVWDYSKLVEPITFDGFNEAMNRVVPGVIQNEIQMLDINSCDELYRHINRGLLRDSGINPRSGASKVMEDKFEAAYQLTEWVARLQCGR